MKDLFGRPVRSIRISVTKQCNLSCFYCHNEGNNDRPSGEMSPDEIGKIGRVAASLGVKKAKLTGGEPLVRNDIAEIVAGLASHMDEVSLTTNGILLEQAAPALKIAGLARVNISLDTLDRLVYRKITGLGRLDDAMSGIRAAVRNGLTPVKLNMVVMKGLNDDSIWKIAEFAQKEGAILQLIELEADRKDRAGGLYGKYHFELGGIERRLAQEALRVETNEMHRRRKYILAGDSEIEIVRPMHNTEFCANCNRIRLTPDGKLKPCLFETKGLVDLIGPLRGGASSAELRVLFRKAVESRKPYWR